ncbi:hypothetical protein IQ266_10615 [filamentous cyanobacterium LEGE 11480]|uniref:Type I restriction enzyme R protein N-terminal domain-containing protein n=1 Tax=Romeriopsis navalis LEGE 11480 TaxID=2777977 RepID=A0A928Z299_9CYAN|nr:hypothetical protein [Romeriopsis navalis]MBE9030181.1 hypothetical protein [Romeriopsis navalis LEGE 11480]
MTQTIPKRKKPFSSFIFKEACQYLGINEIQRWNLSASSVPIIEFFQQRLERLQRFDLEALDVSRTLLIDAICEEGLEGRDRLKVWKGTYLEGEAVCGNADYLIAERRAYLEAPFVCVIEAKKDDFEQGAAQCLVEMNACQWTNQQMGRSIDIYGIVTNGEGWKFYRLTTQKAVFESLLYGIGEMSILLGLLRHVFAQCEQNLKSV